jgi:predicted nucleic acid-binding Zn ribbon protein
MERAGRVLRKLSVPGGCPEPEAMARAAWAPAVGKRIAARTRAVGFSNGCLLVEVTDPVWLPQLETMRAQILPRLQEIAGQETVRALRFREGLPRIEPQRAAGARARQDEADGIEDPVLRRLYKASRSRSLA